MPEARTIKLVLAYDGAGFHGWQRQPGLRTVQETVQQVAQRVLGHPLSVIGASRTDSGVHARGQVAHLRTTTTIPVDNLRRAIGHRLPADVAIVDAREAPPGFHAIRHAREKLYRYRIFNDSRRPIEQMHDRRCWHVWAPLDLDRMRAAAALLCGRHDFSAFAAAGNQREHNVRTVTRIDVRRRFSELLIDVRGDGFVYNQVRNMVGTLVEIARGRWAPERIEAILAARDRQMAGPTAPPEGLCLQWIAYPPLGELA